MNIQFDSLQFAKRLKAAGFTEEQAEALASEQALLIDERLATKEDIALIQRDMKELETSLKRDMKELETSLKHDMRELEQRITIRLGGMMAASIVLVAALVKLL